jgi:hypothetical protein
VEPEAKTFLEESGIFDSELSTKKHDSIVLSLLEKERMKEVILSAYPDVREGLGHWASDFVISDPQSAHKVLELPTWDVVNERLTSHEICEVFKREHQSSSITVDYVRRQVTRLQEEASSFRLLERPAVDITAMYPIARGKSDEKTIIGYADFFVTLTYRGTTHFSPFKSSRMRRSDFFVEVRTKVPNVGSVLKQIRTYMEFTKARPILVSPVNKSVKKAFEAQGIPVYLWGSR